MEEKQNTETESTLDDKTDSQNAEPNNGGNEDSVLSDDQKELVSKMIQSEVDRVRTEKTKVIKKLEEERDEAIKAGMKESERKQFELDKALSEVEREKAELRAEKLKNISTDLLNENKLPLSFRTFIVGSDEETTKQNIESLKKEFDIALDTAINERMKGIGTSPPSSDGGEIPSELQELEKKQAQAVKDGNTLLAITLKQEIFELKRKG